MKYGKLFFDPEIDSKMNIQPFYCDYIRCYDRQKITGNNYCNNKYCALCKFEKFNKKSKVIDAAIQVKLF